MFNHNQDSSMLNEKTRNKMSTARLITKACKENLELFNKCPSQDINEVARALEEVVFLDKKTIQSFICNQKPKVSFRECLSKTDEHVSNIPYESFRCIIYNLYLKEQIVPDKTDILKYIHSSTKTYTEGDLTIDLKANKFVLRKLSNTRKAIIAEDPNQVYRRMTYLNKIRTLRHVKKNFVYVIYRDKTFSITMSPQSGDLIFQSFKNITGDKETRALKCVGNLVTKIPKCSVIVFDTQDILQGNSHPNQYSSKDQMIEWLRKHNIPHTENAHTAELYELIQRFSIKKTCNIYDYLTSHGFDVLLVPSESKSLSYFHPIFGLTKDLSHMAEAGYVKAMFGKYGSQELIVLEELLKEEEVRVYNQDLEMEKVIDAINYAAVHADDLPKTLVSCNIWEEEVKTPYIILH